MSVSKVTGKVEWTHWRCQLLLVEWRFQFLRRVRAHALGKPTVWCVCVFYMYLCACAQECNSLHCMILRLNATYPLYYLPLYETNAADVFVLILEGALGPGGEPAGPSAHGLSSIKLTTSSHCLCARRTACSARWNESLSAWHRLCVWEVAAQGQDWQILNNVLKSRGGRRPPLPWWESKGSGPPISFRFS